VILIVSGDTRMGNYSPKEMERGYLLPAGCKDLVDALNLQGKQEMAPWGIRVWRSNEMSASQLRLLGLAYEYLTQDRERHGR
jgi:hypothetical protein